MQRAKKFVQLNLFLLAGLVLSIVFIDKPLAVFINNNLTFAQSFFYNFTSTADRLASNTYYLLLLSCGLGLLFLLIGKTRKITFVLLAFVFTVLTSLFVTNSMKFEFKRARPDVYIKSNKAAADFYNNETKDYSFPSAHTSFYLSLFLPAALVFRRFAPALLFIPGIIIIGRVVQNEHYLSDVLCSITIVFNFCALVLMLFYLLENRLKVNKAVLEV